MKFEPRSRAPSASTSLPLLGCRPDICTLKAIVRVQSMARAGRTRPVSSRGPLAGPSGFADLQLKEAVHGSF
jgi:hypothetical protein